MAEALVERDLTLIYGGGNAGLMGLLANTVLEAGGRVVGIIPQNLFTKEVTHCLLYTSPSPRDQRGSRMPSSA